MLIDVVNDPLKSIKTFKDIHKGATIVTLGFLEQPRPPKIKKGKKVPASASVIEGIN